MTANSPSGQEGGGPVNEGGAQRGSLWFWEYEATLSKKPGNFYVDLVTSNQHGVVGGPFDTLAEVLEFFNAACVEAPDVNLRVRESAEFNFVHAFSFNGRIHTHDPPRRLKMHG